MNLRAPCEWIMKLWSKDQKSPPFLSLYDGTSCDLMMIIFWSSIKTYRQIIKPTKYYEQIDSMLKFLMLVGPLFLFYFLVLFYLMCLCIMWFGKVHKIIADFFCLSWVAWQWRLSSRLLWFLMFLNYKLSWILTPYWLWFSLGCTNAIFYLVDVCSYILVRYILWIFLFCSQNIITDL